MRGFLWFESGELSEIIGKIRNNIKWGYEARWEVDVIATLFFGSVFAFSYNIWVGIFYL